METIIRKIRDIQSDEKRVLEQVVGHLLTDNQQLTIQVENLPNSGTNEEKTQEIQPTSQLPAWCHVYAGLTDEQTLELEKGVLKRCDLYR